MKEHKGAAARIQAEASAELNNIGRLKAELHEITLRQTAKTDSLVLRATASVLADFITGWSER